MFSIGICFSDWTVDNVNLRQREVLSHLFSPWIDRVIAVDTLNPLPLLTFNLCSTFLKHANSL